MSQAISYVIFNNVPAEETGSRIKRTPLTEVFGFTWSKFLQRHILRYTQDDEWWSIFFQLSWLCVAVIHLAKKEY